MPTAKPLAVRMLEQRGIEHEVFAFDAAIRAADVVASEVGMSAHLVYKTLVIEQDPPRGKPYLAMVPSDTEVDLRHLAAALGVKKLRMAAHRDAERLTGMQVGGIGALGLLGRGFPVLIDERALAEPHILVSAGQRGLDVRLAVADLVMLTGARAITVAG